MKDDVGIIILNTYHSRHSAGHFHVLFPLISAGSLQGNKNSMYWALIILQYNSKLNSKKKFIMETLKFKSENSKLNLRLSIIYIV